MYQLSERCKTLREEFVHTKSHVRYFSVQRDVYYTLGVCEARKKGLTAGEVVLPGWKMCCVTSNRISFPEN